MHHNKFNFTNQFKVSLIVAASLLVAIFCFFLVHYSPQEVKALKEEVAIDTRNNAELIRGVLEDKSEKTPEPQGDFDDDAFVESEHQSQPNVDAEYNKQKEKEDLAAQSAISVFGEEVRPAANETSNNSSHEPMRPNAEKSSFLEKASDPVKTQISDMPHPANSPYEVKAGSIIPAILETSLNSDLPGEVTARVSQHVYDTVTGNFLLIPQGTTLLGIYDPEIAYGQKRAMVVWQRMIFPNGKSMQLEGQNTVDAAGHSGLRDKVNNHYLKLYGNAMVFSLITAAGQLSQPQKKDEGLTTQQILYASAGQELAQTSAQVIAKNLAIKPTIEVRAGSHLNVMLGQDLVVEDVYRFEKAL